MKKSRYTKERIVGILKESEAGLDTDELCRKHGISQQTFYRWKAKYGGLEVNDAQWLRQLEEENRKLKQLVAEQALGLPDLCGGREAGDTQTLAQAECLCSGAIAAFAAASERDLDDGFPARRTGRRPQVPHVVDRGCVHPGAAGH